MVLKEVQSMTLSLQNCIVNLILSFDDNNIGSSIESQIWDPDETIDTHA